MLTLKKISKVSESDAPTSRDDDDDDEEDDDDEPSNENDIDSQKQDNLPFRSPLGNGKSNRPVQKNSTSEFSAPSSSVSLLRKFYFYLPLIPFLSSSFFIW